MALQATKKLQLRWVNLIVYTQHSERDIALAFVFDNSVLLGPSCANEMFLLLLLTPIPDLPIYFYFWYLQLLLLRLQ